MKRFQNIRRVFIAAAFALVGAGLASQSAFAYTNPPVPTETGTTTETCDIRNNQDYGSSDPVVDQSLRQRLDLFNAASTGGTSQCIFLMYFLDPYTIQLKQPLKIAAVVSTLKNGMQAGTYLSGRKEDGTPIGAVIDAQSITGASSSQCAFMIEGGLATFQQIHDITILVGSANKAICDEHGNDLMNQPIPSPSPVRACASGTLAKDCDFKNVTVIANNPTPETPPTCHLTKTASASGGDDLTWTTTHATGATLSDGTTTLSTALNSSTPVHVDPTVTTTYTLSATGPGGSCEDSVTITPPPPVKPTCTLSQAPSGGGGFDLTWTSANGTMFTLGDGTTTNPVTANGTQHVTPASSTTYTFTVDGPGGECVATTVVTPPPPATTCDITSTPALGGGFNVNWTSTNATTVAVKQDGTTFSTLPSGTHFVNPSSSTTFLIDASGPGGSCSKSVVVLPPSAVAPTCSLTQAPGLGGSFDLSWVSSGATTITLSDGTTTNPVAASGTQNVTPSVATTYTLTATNAGGSCTSSVLVVPGTTITPAPTCNLSASSGMGGSYDLTWLTTNATTVTLSDGTTTTTEPSSGTSNVTPSVTTTYTLTAINAAGSCSTVVTINPGLPLPPPVPTCSLIATSGGAGSFDLTWLTTNATSATLSDGSTTLSTLLAGTKNVTPVGPTTYTVVATNSSGSCSTAVTLPPSPVPPAPTCNLTYAPGAGNSYDLSWTTSGAVTVTLTDGTTTLSTAPSGTHNVTPTVPTTYTLTAMGAGGTCTNAITLAPPNSLPPTSACNLTATVAGSGFDLTWSTTGATSVSLSDGTSILSTAASGTQSVTPLVTTTYTLNAIGPGGTCSKAIILTPGSPVPAALTCSLNAAAASGTSFDLTWVTANATTITLGDGTTTNPVAASGTQNVTPSATTIYTLSASGAGGSCSVSKTLPPVTPLPSGPTCNLTAVAGAGSSFDLTWSSTGTTNVTLTDGTTTLSTAASGTKNVVPGAVTTYTLNAIGAGGSCSKSIILTPGSPVPASPTCSLAAAGGSAGTFELDWNTTNATTVHLTDGTTTLSSAVSGTKIVTPTGTTTYTLTATGAGGACSAASTLPPVTPLPSGPTCSLTAAAGAGSSFDLTWTTTGATTVTLSDGTTTLSSANSGTKNVTPAATTTYTLTATGSGGSCSKAITVTPGSPVPTTPTCSLTAASGMGGSFELDWSTANATTVHLTDGTTTLSSAASGSQIVTPSATTTYTLTATSPGGSCTAARTIVPASGTPPPTCTFTSAMGTGSSFDLTWMSSGATSVALTDGTTTLSTSASGTKNVTPTTSTTYTLTATNAGGTCSRAVVLGPGSFGSAPTCTLTSASSASGSGFDLTWTTTGATTATLTEGATQLSTLLNSAAPVTVDPSSPTPYILTATNAGGSCSSIVLLSPIVVPSNNTPQPPTCDLTVTISGTGFDLSWTTADATSVTVDDGTNTLSNDPNPSTPLHVVPGDFNTSVYNLTATGEGGTCKRSQTLQPLSDIIQGGGPFTSAGGCSLNAQPESRQNLLGFLTLGLPVVMLRVVRRRRTAE